jgi:hypothetical protein
VIGLECLVEFPDCNLYFRAPAVLCSALFRDGESSNTPAKRRRTSAVHQPAVVRQKFSTATTIVRFSQRKAVSQDRRIIHEGSPSKHGIMGRSLSVCWTLYSQSRIDLDHYRN